MGCKAVENVWLMSQVVSSARSSTNIPLNIGSENFVMEMSLEDEESCKHLSGWQMRNMIEADSLKTTLDVTKEPNALLASNRKIKKDRQI